MADMPTCSTVAPKLCRGVGELSDLSSAHVPALGSYSMGCSILAIWGAGQGVACQYSAAQCSTVHGGGVGASQVYGKSYGKEVYSCQ